MNNAELIASGKHTITIERNALTQLIAGIDDTFASACQLILASTGRVVVMGVGKSGHIGKKIAATLASTGTPAFFVHPSEAGHGDIGMITPNDIVLAMSNSGNSTEILALLPALKRQGNSVIALVGNAQSALAKNSQIVLHIPINQEACPHNLAPTTSTTAALALGDALAVALLQANAFSRDDFARSHPGGALGRRLLLTVSDVMRRNHDVPAVLPDATLNHTLALMSEKGLGMTTITDTQHRLLGIFTDGDLRRAIDQGANISGTCVGKLMTPNPQTISQDTLALHALELMEAKKITTLVVADDNHKIEGVLHLHDLLRAGLV